MKQLLFAFIGAFSFLAVGMDAPQSLSFWNGANPVATDIRCTYVYPELSIQELGRVAQVNQQCLKEIGYIRPDFKELMPAIREAWYCYGEAGCCPKGILCFINVSHDNMFQLKQEQLIAHYIKKNLISRLWSKENVFIDNDTLAHSCSFSNNHITLQPAGAETDMICIEDVTTERKGALNNIMNIYSIGANSKSLDQKELDLFINNKIQEPVVIVLQISALKNEDMINMLLEQLTTCTAENKKIFCQCLQKLNDCYRNSKIMSLLVEQARQRAQDAIARLIKNQLAAEVADKSESILMDKDEPISSSFLYNDPQGRWQTIPSQQGARQPLPKSKNCLIQ